MSASVRRISVLYFAALRERAGVASEEVEIPDSVRDIAGLAAFLEEHRPALRGSLGQVRFAVGDELAGADRRVEPGDTVALLPPFSGG